MGDAELTVDQKIKLAKKRLQSLADEIKLIRDKGNAAAADPNIINAFRGMFRSIDTTYNKFMDEWKTLETLYVVADKEAEFPSQKETDSYKTVKRYYYEAGGTYEALCQTSKEATASTSAPNFDFNILNQSLSARMRLPPIHIPKFSGQLRDWPLFKDTFLSVVHEEPSLTNIERYHFLLTNLQGRALSIIKHIPITDEGYQQAWAALLKHYDSKRRLAAAYIDNILNFKPFAGKPTASSLNNFLQVVSESATAFEKMNVPNAAKYILFELAVRGLDTTMREAFETKQTDNEFPTCDILTEFVRKKVKALELIEGEKGVPEKSPAVKPPVSPQQYDFKKSKPANKSTTTFFTKATSPSYSSTKIGKGSSAKTNNSPNTTTGPPTCFLCKQRHKLTDCPIYQEASPEERFNKLQNWAICKNCLFPGHRTKECGSSWRCHTCGGKHHTTLHFVKPSSSQSSSTKTSSNPLNKEESKETSFNAFTDVSSNISSEVLLGTAVVLICDNKGFYHQIRLVIDSGSQYSFITESCASKLELEPLSFDKSISGINQSTLCYPDKKVICKLRPLNSISPELSTEAIVVPTIAPQIPQRKLTSDLYIKFKHCNLADPNFCRPGPIDFLLGADLFLDILMNTNPNSQEQNELQTPKTLNTIFGEVIMGKCDQRLSSTATSLFVTDDQNINTIMHRFWEVEEIRDDLPKMSAEDYVCEEHFQTTHTRTPEGRYVVALPFKNPPIHLGPSRSQALKRLNNLENKLSHDPLFSEEYHTFMKEYLELGHMVQTNKSANYIIPHHGVHKIVADVPKLRVVFDASARTSNGSLNEHLLSGPKLQKDISDILLNFRRHKFVITADIVKMYRQVLVTEEDRSYQHILWRFSEELEINEFELTTITYGLKSSPFLALRVIKQLVVDEGDKFPLAAHSLIHDIYVDDIVSGAPTMTQVLALKEQLIELLSQGCFKLSKWASNCPNIINSVEDESSLQPHSFTETDDLGVKILGLQWDPAKDVFSYSIKLPNLPPTKRSILSTIARIYDPLGYLSPTVFYVKILLQEIWKSGLDWDDTVTSEIQQLWQDYLSDISNLNQVIIPRYILLDETSHKGSIFGFCDASERGYCAVLYVVTDHNTSNQVFLLKAKTKLAPIKPMTIPRLELCAALLLARLYKSIASFTEHLNIKSLRFFTDSSTVLSWLHTPAHTLKTFVAHRVIGIIEITGTSSWRHIKSKDNPADCGSRGLLPSKLIEHDLWWSGPSWISTDEEHWPTSNVLIPSTELPEIKNNCIALTTISSEISAFVQWTERFSKYLRLIRTIAYVRRFQPSSKFPGNKRPTGPIMSEEFDASNIQCIKLLQRFYYPEAFNNSKPSQLLLSLNAFLDQTGVLRVGGRLRHSDLPDESKHPILLPKRSHFTNILVDYFHLQLAHSGPATILATIQQKYWIPAGRSLVKHRKLKCLTCYRTTKQHHIPRMGDLPPERFASVRPFYHTGVDFAGPFLCKETSRRKSPIKKAYLCLFVCLSTKAVHLELVPSLSTEDFIDALDRFIARRGKPAKILSDCGRNFVGASNYLAEVASWHDDTVTQHRLTEHLNSHGTQWLFIPPYAPHFGGIWEAGVKSTKTLLKKIIGSHPLTEHELNTIFIRIEAILNSRPIQPLSTDPNDLQPLTPGHFLVGGPLTALPEADVTQLTPNRLNRWQLLREKIQSFWKRWKTQYLQTLQQRNKWRKETVNINQGDLVLVKDIHTPPLQWPMARVLEVHPGADQVVRVATVRTTQGVFKRPVIRLLPLPHLSEDN